MGATGQTRAPRQRRDLLAQSARPFIVGMPHLTAMLLITCAGLALEHALLPSATALIPPGAAVLIDCWLWRAWVAKAHGYARATPEAEAQIRSGKLFHYTGNHELIDTARRTGRAHLDPARCRTISLMFPTETVLGRHSRAVYAFTRTPGRGELAINVPRKRRKAVLELDGTAITGRMRIRLGDGAVALLDGYNGPVRVTLLPQ